MRPLLTLIALLLPVSASAQGWIEPLLRPGSRPIPIPQPARVEKLRTSVTVRVTDRVARVEVEELFRNAGGGVAEGDYIYPLAGEAVFSDFSLFQGEEELKGEAMDARTARAIYEEIVRRRRDPALIELAGHGLLRARVFPFGPGETRTVRLQFTQVLERAGDALRFRYVAGSPNTGARPVTARSAAARTETPLTFTLVSDNASRFGEPFSPTHRLRTTRDGTRLTVRPAGDLSGTVDVFLPLAAARVGIALATHRVDGEDGYFMLTLSPGAVEGPAAPRDVAVVVDTSGSMSGEKIEQARDALRQLLGTLSERDRFRLVAFGSRVETQAPSWTPASRAALARARAWVDRLSASGGTNIAGALEEAFRTPGERGRLHIVIFVTDGLPTVGETNPDRIAAAVEAAGSEARIFAFGVGYDLNTYLLERVAAAGRGTVDYVEPGEDVEDAVGALANRISRPVLVDLAFDGAPVRLKDMQPPRLPDLYAGQELIVFGRYEAPAGTARGQLSIRGTRDGRTERFAATVEFPSHESTGAYLPGLWAARKVGELMRTIRVEGATPERIDDVRALALRYGLVTEYTSYLVQEPGLTARSQPGDVQNARRAGVGGGNGSAAGGGRGAAPAPDVTVVGEAAVVSAQSATQLRSLTSVADAAAAQERLALAGSLAERAELESGTARIVAGRRFRLESGAWIDAAHTATARVVHVEPFSPAYFAILAKLPELRPYWSEFETSTVAGREVSIRVAPGGQTTMSAAAVDALVREFRFAADRQVRPTP